MSDRNYASYWNNYEGDPLMKVGGEAELEEHLQSRFCLVAGLKEKDVFLDYGCGCLRGTLGLVQYLLPDHFHGCDISEKLVQEGYVRAKERYGNDCVDLRIVDGFEISDLFGKKFDFILSVSLLTHILGDDLEFCFNGVSRVLKKNGRWFFTIYPLDEGDEKPFRGDIGLMFYKRSYLKDIGDRCGLKIDDYGTDLRPNPVASNQFLREVNSTLGQWVMVATKK